MSTHAVEVIDSFLGELRTVSTTGGGTALSTTRALVFIPRGTHWFSVTPRNLVTGAEVAQVGFCPWGTVLVAVSGGDAADALRDDSVNAQDGDAATDITLSLLATLADGGRIYVGSSRRFRGIYCDVDAANGTAATILVEYWANNRWVDASATDGTASGGATFAIDGAITWTVPAAWGAGKLNEMLNLNPRDTRDHAQRNMYWMRISVSAAMDAATTLNSLVLLQRSANLTELIDGQTFTMRQPDVDGHEGTSAVEVFVDAGTGNLVVNAAARKEFLSD